MENEMASCTWAKGFLRRYPHIKVHWGTNLSVARTIAANEPNICNWFKEYINKSSRLVVLCHLNKYGRWQDGDTECTQRRKNLGEVKKPLYNHTPADHGEMSTVLTFVNVVGRVCPPMVIHKGQWV